jgi:hypothetical protein
MSLPARRTLSWIGVFLLPMGFLGLLALPIMLLLLIDRLWCKEAPRGGWGLKWTLPLSLITPAASWLSPDPALAFPKGLGLGALYLLGLPAMRSLEGDLEGLLTAVSLGADGLALSLILDFLFHWHQLPSGLFLYGGLHDWAGTVLALCFPLALSLSQSPRRRRFAQVSAFTILLGNLVALSWTGALGLLLGGLAWLFYARGWRATLFSSLLILTLLGGTLGLSWAQGWSIRGFSARQWLEVVEGRFVMMEEGLKFGLSRPWLGWGELPPSQAPRFRPTHVNFQAEGIDHAFLDLPVDTFYRIGLLGTLATAWLFLGLFTTSTQGGRAALLGLVGAQIFDYAFSQSTVVLLAFFAGSLLLLERP